MKGDDVAAHYEAAFVLTSPRAKQRDRVGGGLTAAVLPHHRAYGSVHGGSGHAVKPIDRIQYRDQSKSVP